MIKPSLQFPTVISFSAQSQSPCIGTLEINKPSPSMASTFSTADNSAASATPAFITAAPPAAAEAAGANIHAAEAESLAAAAKKEKVLEEKWPGWPGYSVFRLLVPLLKVGSIIGRKGDLVKKLVEETRTKVRVLDGPLTSADRVVLISGKEEPEAALSPAMDAVIRIFKRVNGLPENDGDDKADCAAFCSTRLLVPSTQASSLIGKQGSLIRSIQESSGASVRVLSNDNFDGADEVRVYASPDERIVEIQGEALKVLKAFEAVIGHLRSFLVDHSVLPLFEKSYNAPATQERQQVESWPDNYLVSRNRGSLYRDRERQLESSRFSSLYRQEPSIVTQISQTMQIPLAYAEDIIGVEGANIDYIRRISGAILIVQESPGRPEEITVVIKGTPLQVHAAQQLIQDFTSDLREPFSSSYGKFGSSLRPSYSHSYGSSGLGGSSNYRQ